MGKILDFIAEETCGECFKSFKFCYDTQERPQIEYDDASSNFQNMKDFAEDVHDNKPRDLRQRAEICMQGPPLFKFFLDGSRHVYKLDDVQWDKKVYPVLAGQISVACCQREMAEDLKSCKFSHIDDDKCYSVLCLPVTANSDGVSADVFFGNLLKKINERLDNLNLNFIDLQKVLSYSTSLQGQETFERKATARIQDEMIDCEKRIVSSLTAKHLLNQDSYLIKDGSIQYKPVKSSKSREIALIRNNYRHVVGVSKSFNPNKVRDNKDQSYAGQIARLPLYHRTPAFLWRPGEGWGNVNFAVWYVRIRDIRYTSSPYSGVLKIEKMLITDEENENGLSSDLIDTITANIINERNPVCYGNDPRWANHLYPVYMTERFCKSRFLSEYNFLNLF